MTSQMVAFLPTPGMTLSQKFTFDVFKTAQNLSMDLLYVILVFKISEFPLQKTVKTLQVKIILEMSRKVGSGS